MSAPSGVRQRITLADIKVPQRIAAPHMQRVRQQCRGEERSHALWSMEVLRYTDGRIRVGFLALMDAGHAGGLFMQRRTRFGAPHIPILTVVRMAHAGMSPRHTVALSGPEPEETEVQTVGQHTLRISKVFRGVFDEEAMSTIAVRSQDNV